MPLARSNGFKISYEVSGDGPPLVLHPGMFQDGAHWTHSGYTSSLTPAYTVIAVDTPGLGAGDAPREVEAYALERRVAYVTAVLDDVGADRAAFWGYSLGAMTGYAVAALAPDRLTCLVAGAWDPIGGFRLAIEPTLRQSALHAELAASGVPMMLYAGAADPWHDPMRTFADRTGVAAFFSLPDADHKGGWDRSGDVLPQVLPFLAANT
ncbi:alpha/beta fold hydrolase [Nonomuraea sp. 10N515B]|uniref:alpha/beta fold hydrolase n=1 Tax=Nonomuraea sp. 10N515B TaxID=3457422 RepID=UPI003FCCB492